MEFWFIIKGSNLSFEKKLARESRSSCFVVLFESCWGNKKQTASCLSKLPSEVSTSQYETRQANNKFTWWIWCSARDHSLVLDSRQITAFLAPDKTPLMMKDSDSPWIRHSLCASIILIIIWIGTRDTLWEACGSPIISNVSFSSHPFFFFFKSTMINFSPSNYCVKSMKTNEEYTYMYIYFLDFW